MKNDKEVSQYMNVLLADNLRLLIKQVNELEIQHRDIVSIEKNNNGSYFLVYYKDK